MFDDKSKSSSSSVECNKDMPRSRLLDQQREKRELCMTSLLGILSTASVASSASRMGERLAFVNVV